MDANARFGRAVSPALCLRQVYDLLVANQATEPGTPGSLKGNKPHEVLLMTNED